jgi:hypothetical protein
MDGSRSHPDSLDQSLRRLSAAIDHLERAAERRMRHDETRANAEEEYALMQDDRSRLAVELDAALDHSRALERASAEASERLGAAAETISQILERMGPPAP